MAKYKFNNINGGLEIEPVTTEFPVLTRWDRDTKIGEIEAKLTTADGTIFRPLLDNIDLPTVNGGTMDSKGQLRLDDYLI